MALSRLDREEYKMFPISLLSSADKTVGQAMIIHYHQLYKSDVMCEIQELTAMKDPTNELLLIDLFMEYVRVANYLKQFQTAQALYRLHPYNPYYFWAVMSIVMQAIKYKAAGDKEKQLVLLTSAQSMVEELIQNDGSIEAEQEVRLYIMILEMQGKLKEALEVTEGPLGKMLVPYIVASKRVDFLVKLGRWKEANVTIKQMLRDNMDNCSLYPHYFNTVFHLIDGENTEPNFNTCNGEKPDKTAADCAGFLCQLQAQNLSQLYRVRGPYLAQLDFFARLKARGENAEQYFGSLIEIMFMYFFDFGENHWVLCDLQRGMDLLQPKEVSQFLNKIFKIIELEKRQIPTTKLQMLQYISRTIMARYLGIHEALSYKSKLQHAAYLMHCYHIGIQLHPVTGLPPDLLSTDTFVLIVVDLMKDVWMETGVISYLIDAIVVLEHICERRPSNFQIKLFLIRLYNRLGISKAASGIFNLLHIEESQLYTLGYLQFWPLLFTGHYQFASQLFDSAIRYFAHRNKTSAHLLGTAFINGSFQKIPELVECRNRLNKSLYNSLVSVEKNLLEIFHASSFHEALIIAEMVQMVPKDGVDWSNFIDDRDFSVYWRVEPRHRLLTRDLEKTSFKHDLQYLRYRTLLLRIIVEITKYFGSVFQLNPDIDNDIPIDEEDGTLGKSSTYNDNTNNFNKQDPREVLDLLGEELMLFNQNFAEKELPLNRDWITAPDESRIFAVMKSSYTQFLMHLLRILFSILSSDASVISATKLRSTCSDAVANLDHEIFKLSTLVRTTKPTQLVQRHEILFLLTLIIEMVCIATFVCGMVQFAVTNEYLSSILMKKFSTNENESNAINEPSDEFAGNKLQYPDLVNQLIHGFNNSMRNLDRIIDTLEVEWKNISLKDENNCCLLYNLKLGNDKISELLNSVQNKIGESYITSLTEIRFVLNNKMKYLSLLSLKLM